MFRQIDNISDMKHKQANLIPDTNNEEMKMPRRVGSTMLNNKSMQERCLQFNHFEIILLNRESFHFLSFFSNFLT